MNKAQAEGSKALEALVKEGRKTQSASRGQTLWKRPAA
ncbi:MAG: hypothetical protein IPH54_16190 [Rhodoferax sp.]|nr:hypothetical protein [Rhodoferax sp.]